MWGASLRDICHVYKSFTIAWRAASPRERRKQARPGSPVEWLALDGFEVQLGTNHLGPFALTALVFPLLAHEGARVVTETSSYYSRAKINFDDLQSRGKYGAWPAYGQSKLANVLFMRELDRRSRAANAGLMSVAAHPGIAKTNLQYACPALGKRGVVSVTSRLTRLMGQSAEQGALPSLYGATAFNVEGGSLFGPDGRGQVKGNPTRVDIKPAGLDEDVAKRLWAVSEELTGVPFAVGAV